jgi:hypothetical protein
MSARHDEDMTTIATLPTILIKQNHFSNDHFGTTVGLVDLIDSKVYNRPS